MKIISLNEIQGNNYLNRAAMAFLLYNHIDPSEFATSIPDYGRNYNIDNYVSLASRLNYSEEFIKYILSNNKKKFIIIGDYDVDGTMGTTIFVEVFRAIGIDVDFIIPDRLNDGYGISRKHIDEAKNLGGEIIITVDNGISCYDALGYAAELGLDVIITDHHRPQEKLPTASLIIDPWLNDDEFQPICGAAVAMKLLLPLINYITDKRERDGIRNEIVFYAAIATIADMMPLLGENRILINAVLIHVNFLKSRKYWWGRILKVVSGFGPKLNETDIIDEDTIKFYIAPTINSVSRMGGDMKELINKILNCNQQNIYINDYHQYNYERKNLVRNMVKDLKLNDDSGNFVVFNPDDYDKPIKGVCGLVANKLISDTEKVSLVGMINNDMIDMSGRSIHGYSIYDGFLRLQKQLPELNITGGGHESAIGLRFKIQDENTVQLFEDAFKKDIEQYAELVDSVYIELDPSYIEELVIEKLKFKTFGQDFENLKLSFSGVVQDIIENDKVAIININGIGLPFRYFTNDMVIGSPVEGTCTIMTLQSSWLLKVEKVFKNGKIS